MYHIIKISIQRYIAIRYRQSPNCDYLCLLQSLQVHISADWAKYESRERTDLAGVKFGIVHPSNDI